MTKKHLSAFKRPLLSPNFVVRKIPLTSKMTKLLPSTSFSIPSVVIQPRMHGFLFTTRVLLIETISNSEVRRAALLNIPLANHTLPAILARSRDTDTVIRRLVYSAVLEKNCTTPDGSPMGPLHPRVLTIAQRELIIRNGLGDREPAVRTAAGSLLGTWVDVVRGLTKPEEGEGILEDVLGLLGLFDLTENTVAEDALLSIFATRIDIFDHLEFKGAYMHLLKP